MVFDGLDRRREKKVPGRQIRIILKTAVTRYVEQTKAGLISV